MKTILYKGKEVKLSKDQVKKLRAMQLNIAKFQNRLVEGWSFDDALKYNHYYVMYHDKVCRKIKAKEVTYFALAEDLERYNIDVKAMQKHLNEGDFLGDILPLDCRFWAEYDKNLKNQLMLSDYRRINRRKELETQRQRELKPWLYDGTAQVHPRGKYTQYLMKTSIYPKAVR